MNLFLLSFKNSVFKGTPRCTLTDHNTGKRYITSGSGMDLKPTLLSLWATDCYQEEWLQRDDLFDFEFHIDTKRTIYVPTEVDARHNPARKLIAHLATADTEPVRVEIPDDGYGTVFAILREIGVNLHVVYDKNRNQSWISGYIVQEKGEW